MKTVNLLIVVAVAAVAFLLLRGGVVGSDPAGGNPVGTGTDNRKTGKGVGIEIMPINPGTEPVIVSTDTRGSTSSRSRDSNIRHQFDRRR